MRTKSLIVAILIVALAVGYTVYSRLQRNRGFQLSRAALVAANEPVISSACANSVKQLNALIDRNSVFAPESDLAVLQAQAQAIMTMRNQLYATNCLSEKDDYLATVRQAYHMSLSFMSWAAIPRPADQLAAIEKSPSFVYLSLAMTALQNTIVDGKYPCETLRIEQEENNMWLASNPLGTTVQNKADTEAIGHSMMTQMSAALQAAGCLPPTPSVKQLVT